MKNILVGVEFHENFDNMLNKAREIAQLSGGKLWLLHVITPEPEFAGHPLGPQYIQVNRHKEQKKEREILEEHAQKLKESGIRAESLMIQGNTAETILVEARELDIDLIICGTHKHSFFYKLLFGDTAVEVVRESNIPVLVVPLDVKE